MSADQPRHRIRRDNLELLRLDPKIGSLAAIARALGRPDARSYLSALRSRTRGMGDDLAREIEDALGKPRGWMDLQHPVTGENDPGYLEAQELSHHLGFDGIPLMRWEDIMTNSEPLELFRAALHDDAMAPEFPTGTEIVWTTRRRASPGRLVLVRDRHGVVHARAVHQGRSPGQWLAAPTNPAYITLDSEADGLELVAVFKGRLEPDDD